jgi:phage terminase large subunit-like protein
MAATTQDQAAICFNAAKAILTRVNGLGLRYTIREHRLIVKKNQTYIRYISSEAGATEGKGASVVIFDEEHLQVTNELRDNLKSGMGAREQPLFISISTAGTDKNSPYYQHIKTCKKILDGLIQDDSHLVLIYEAPEINGKVDWENPEVWKIANPNWGVSVLEDNFIVDYTEAKN